MMNPVKSIALSLLLLCAISGPLSGQANWRLAHRVQLGYEQDSNIAESVEGAVQAENLRLLYDLQVRRRSLSFSYRAGAQVYPDFSSENKLTHEIGAAFSRPVSARVELGAQLWSRFKFFLETEQDLICGLLQPFLRYRMDTATWLELGLRQEALDYANSDYFDYAGPGLTLQLYRRIISGWTLSPSIAWQRNVFQRASYGYASSGSYLFLQPDRQEDEQVAAGLHSEWVWRSLLMTCQYKFESNHSNSYGYDYRRHVLTALFVQGWREWFFRGYFSWQKKTYSDAIRPFLPVQLDTEQEENNLVALDVSRNLYERLAVVGRIAWYQNESPWADLYYRKRLLQALLEWRF